MAADSFMSFLQASVVLCFDSLENGELAENKCGRMWGPGSFERLFQGQNTAELQLGD